MRKAMRESANTPTHGLGDSAPARPSCVGEAAAQRLMQQHSRARSQTFSFRVRSIAHGATHANDSEPPIRRPRFTTLCAWLREMRTTRVRTENEADGFIIAFPHDAVWCCVRQLRGAARGRRASAVCAARARPIEPAPRRSAHEAKAKHVPLDVGASRCGSRVRRTFVKS